MSSDSAPLESPSEHIVQQVAKRAKMDPLELPPLCDAADPEAVDTLVESMEDGHVRFSYAGYVVTVHSDETIDVAHTPGTSSGTGEAAADD